MTDQERTWLDNLKAGDEVLCKTVYRQQGFTRKVKRTTPSQIIIQGLYFDEIKYWRKTGLVVGCKSGWLVQP